MKRILSLAVAGILVAMVYGCASDAVKGEGQAAVEERTPTPTAGPAGSGTTGAAPSGDVASKPLPSAAATPAATMNPLKDPNNILSKRSVYFDYDSDVIKEEFQSIVRAHARYLVDNGLDKVLIQGNADERGSREYNLALGQRRAEAVKRAMILLNAPDARIEAVSLGEEKPRCEEKTEACYAQNRRGDVLHSGEF